VADFYGKSKIDGLWWDEDGERNYSKDVLTLVPGDKFKSSLRWLVNAEAITAEQADRLDAIYDYRHEIAHELIKYVVDPAMNVDKRLFGNALGVLRAIERFWSQVEIDIGSFQEHGDMTVEDVTPGTMLILQACIDAWVDGLPDPMP
jgi:hypothetical protein